LPDSFGNQIKPYYDAPLFEAGSFTAVF